MTARRYDLLRPIAEGGMGQVFLAELSGEAGFKKRVALKRVKPALSSDPAFVEKFVSEAKLAVTLSHANIVQTLDLGRLADGLFIAMEYVDGVDLAKVMTSCLAVNEAVPLGAFLHVATEALKALAYAHHHVVHNDISPSNLLVSYAGEVKLTDFGVAMWKSLARQPRVSVAGKLRYLAPEALLGRPLDGRADVYALTIVLREVLALRPVFPEVGDALTDAILRGRAQVPRRADVPERLEALLDRAMALEVERRPTAARFLSELSALELRMMTAPEVGDWVARLAPRTDALPSLDHVLDALAPSGGTQSAPNVKRTASFVVQPASGDGLTRLEPAVTVPRRRRRWPLALAAALVVAIGGAGVVVSRAGSPERVESPLPVPAARAPVVVAAAVPEPVAARAPVVVASPSVTAPRPASTVRKPAPKAVATAPTGVGFLNVSAEPWASVRIDGVTRGTTPLYRLELAPGPHRVSLEREGKLPVVRNVRVEPGETALLDVDLR